MKKIVLIGSGGVATNLGKAFVNNGIEILQVWSKSLKNAQTLAEQLACEGIDDLQAIIPYADVYIFSVKDDALIPTLEAFPYRDKLLLHTAGSQSIDILASFSKTYGVFYPLQTFSKQKEVNFNNVPILLESSSQEVYKSIELLASGISQQVQDVNSQQRKYLHIAAVFSCNFANHFYALSQELLEENGLSFDLIRPLIKETTEKALKFSPKEVQTGPAVRKDMTIINSHLELLEEDERLKQLYKQVSASIMG